MASLGSTNATRPSGRAPTRYGDVAAIVVVVVILLLMSRLCPWLVDLSVP
jgi:hypothetical protein